MGESEVKKRVAEALIESGLEPAKANEISFHLTDWLDDFHELQALYTNIDTVSHEQLLSTITKFLAHVPDHLAAAKKLVGLGPVEDIFGVGALDEED
jgi:hypothetical protein